MGRFFPRIFDDSKAAGAWHKASKRLPYFFSSTFSDCLEIEASALTPSSTAASPLRLPSSAATTKQEDALPARVASSPSTTAGPGPEQEDSTTTGDANPLDSSTTPPVHKEDTHYTFQHVKDTEKNAVANIASMIPCKVRTYSRTAVYDSREDILSSIRFMKEMFPWLKYDESGLKTTGLARVTAWCGYDTSDLEQATFFCEDRQGVLDVHLCGYLIFCNRVNGKFIFRACVAEFNAPVSFDHLTLKIVGSGASILGSTSTSAGAGAAIGIPFDVVTAGAATVVGAIVGGAVGLGVGIVGAVVVNITADAKEKAVEKKLGSSLFDAKKGTSNPKGIMEAFLLHYLLVGQRYRIEGNRVHIEGAEPHEIGGGATNSTSA